MPKNILKHKYKIASQTFFQTTSFEEETRETIQMQIF